MGNRRCCSADLASRHQGRDQSLRSHGVSGGASSFVSSLAYFYDGRAFRRFMGWLGAGERQRRGGDQDCDIQERSHTPPGKAPGWVGGSRRDRVQGTGAVDRKARGAAVHLTWGRDKDGASGHGGLSRAGRQPQAQ